MQLLYFITNRSERIPAVLARLSEAGVNGATVVSCEGMAHMLAESVEAPAFFGSLRSLLLFRFGSMGMFRRAAAARLCVKCRKRVIGRGNV